METDRDIINPMKLDKIFNFPKLQSPPVNNSFYDYDV